MLPDGSSAYTRDGFPGGSERAAGDGWWFQVQPAITIPANALSITIGRDGVVSVTQQGQAAPVQVGQLNLTFMNDTGLESIGENLYTETQSSGAPNESTPGLNGAGLLYQGYVETSNVNVAEELVNMIRCNALTKSTVKRCPPPIRCCKTDATLRLNRWQVHRFTDF